MSRDKAVRLHAQAEQYMGLANQCWAQGERIYSVHYAIYALLKEEHALKLVLKDKTGTYGEDVVCELAKNIVVLELKLNRPDRANNMLERVRRWPSASEEMVAKINELDMLLMQHSIAMKGGGNVGAVVGNDSIPVSSPVAGGVEIWPSREEANDRVDNAEAT